MAAIELSELQESRWKALLGLIEVSDGIGAALDAGGRADGYALGLLDANVISEPTRDRLARIVSTVTSSRVSQIERESSE